MFQSFKYRFILSFVTVELFFIFCIVTVNFFTIDKSSEKFINSQITSTTLLMSELIKSPISVYDIATIDNVVNNNNIPFINSILVLDSQERILSQKYNCQKPIDDILKIKTNRLIQTNNKNLYLIYTPIMIEETPLGSLYILYDMNEFSSVVDDNTKHTALLILLEILVSTLISYLIGAKLTKKLTDLSDSALKIGTTNSEQFIIPHQTDTTEVGILSKSLAKMRDDLKLRNRKLEETKYVFDNIKEAIITLNQNGEITLTNNAFSEITGFSSQEVLGKIFTEMEYGKNKKLFIKILKNLNKKGHWQGEIDSKTKDHANLILWLNITQARNEYNEFYYIIVFADITNEKEKEKQLQIQSKMATMGEMIGNIAHQWRQPLSAISSLSSGMKIQHQMGILSDEELLKGFDTIIESTQFLSHTIEDFRNFFKADKVNVDFQITTVIKKILGIINPILNSNNIVLIQNIIDNPILRGFENELLQAILNIVNNAKDVLVEKNLPKKRFIKIEAKQSGRFYQIIICDNGGGVNSENIDKIFDPYFTTKHKSQGTGIGLYMTHTIITNHFNGSIGVKNQTTLFQGEEYLGACFTIKIPFSG